MRITTISYGIAILVISAIIHYLTLPGLDNCNSMNGIVSTYLSKDYSMGCKILSDVKISAIAGETCGVGVAIFGLLRSRIR